MNRLYFIVWLIVLIPNVHSAQSTPKKFSLTGAARGYFFGDRLNQDLAVEDTVTIPRLNSGHVMADLGLNIRPNKNMEINGMVRVRNDYGGFWGSGVSFDIRQMYVKGVIGGVVRYQLGDINYRLTKYTFWNNDQELFDLAPTALKQQWDVVNYDHFHNLNNSWRQQGGAAEWGLIFNKWVEEIQFRAFGTRVRSSNNSTINDRIFTGGTVQLVQSKHVSLGASYVNFLDVKGTSRNNSLLRNPVVSGNVSVNYQKGRWSYQLESELGRSSTRYLNNEDAPDRDGTFAEVSLQLKDANTGWFGNATLKRVESGFNSPGAQTRRLNLNGQPSAFERIGNDQNLRSFTMMDLMRESSMYNMQLQPYLMSFAPRYDNITPFGAATPNRQGIIVTAGGNLLPGFSTELSQFWLTETRGQGTTEPRAFNRSQVKVKWSHLNEKKTKGRRIVLEGNARLDRTTRAGTEFYRGVDLTTQVVSFGAEYELMEKLDLIAGWQWIQYNGFDFTAVRNEYAEIFNFIDYSVNGKETMSALGLRYRFSDKAFLSAQLNQFHFDDEATNTSHYQVQQFMLLYQINF